MSFLVTYSNQHLRDHGTNRLMNATELSLSKQMPSPTHSKQGHTMNNIFKAIVLTTAAAWSINTYAAPQSYVYTPKAGVNEVKPFHGCFDDDTPASRPQINVVMSGLSTKDVTVETRPLVTNKPSSEMITFRVKGSNASLTVQFLSTDGAHCQQGVASIAFSDAVFKSFADLKITR
jgi:hypothetical protein